MRSSRRPGSPNLPQSDRITNTLESLVNIFYLLKLEPNNTDLVAKCAALGQECMTQLIDELVERRGQADHNLFIE